jgi:hypothetical protein
MKTGMPDRTSLELLYIRKAKACGTSTMDFGTFLDALEELA